MSYPIEDIEGISPWYARFIKKIIIRIEIRIAVLTRWLVVSGHFEAAT